MSENEKQDFTEGVEDNQSSEGMKIYYESYGEMCDNLRNMLTVVRNINPKHTSLSQMNGVFGLIAKLKHDLDMLENRALVKLEEVEKEHFVEENQTDKESQNVGTC